MGGSRTLESHGGGGRSKTYGSHARVEVNSGGDLSLSIRIQQREIEDAGNAGDGKRSPWRLVAGEGRAKTQLSCQMPDVRERRKEPGVAIELQLDHTFLGDWWGHLLR